MPPVKNVAKWTLADYERAAAEYCASLPLEHFMEATGQSTQRRIAWSGLSLIAARRGYMQVFNELLVQYPHNGGVGQVVPDNMVIRSKRQIKTAGSYNTAFESARPFWVLEYVSKSSHRKDYEENMLKYEEELKVPYYLIFDPDRQDLRLFHLRGANYGRVEPNQNGRLPVPELEVEVALFDGWARFWHQGELVPLPEDLQREVDELREQLDRARTDAVMERRRAERQKRRADAAEDEVKRLKALLRQMEEGGGKRSGNGR